MRLLVALLLLICSLNRHPSSNHRFIVFTHDGTFYKLDPQTKQVQWHNQLPFKLLSLDIAPQSSSQLQYKTKKIFIPTIDGDFLYLEHSMYDKHSKQILVQWRLFQVPREDIEHLLDMCFDSKLEQKYFVYQKFEYFVLNTENGQFSHLEDYFGEKLVFDKNVHTVIIVAKKLLKQLNSKLQVKWSVISSKVNLVNVEDFVKNSKLTQTHVQHPKYSFVRIDAKTIQIQDQNKNIVFQIQASSSIMCIFGEDHKLHAFSKMLIKNSEKKMLALGQVGKQMQKSSVSHHIINMIKDQQQNTFQNFPQSISSTSQNQNLNSIQICLKTHQVLKQLSNQHQPRIISPKLKLPQSTSNFSPKVTPEIQFHYTSTFDPQNLPTLPYSDDKRIHVIVTKQQPFVYIFLIVIIIGGALAFYKFKVNKLWQQISQMQNINDQNIKKITAKLGQYQNVGKQLKKMYEINWDKILFRNGSYFIFQGRFLNQNAQVFMIPISGYDIIDIQQKLNILINCSHKSICKLYYYTRNQDSLLIFCQNSATSYHRCGQNKERDVEVYQKFTNNEEAYKNNIKVLMDSLYQLMKDKIQLQSFSEQSLLISESLELKLNIVLSFLVKNNQEQDKKLKEMGTSRLRVDIIKVIHKMGHKGAEFDLLQFQKQKNSQNQENSFLKDFYDHFLLTQHSPVDLQALKSSQKHPFLWDSKQKMLYVCDFSNYVQTCIDEQKIQKMESHCKNFQIIPLPWHVHLHPTLAKQLNNYRKYDFNSTRDLIRLMRNKLSHFHQIPKQTRVYVGKTPEQFVDYFLQKFPKLLSFMYAYATRKKWKLSTVKN